MKRVSKIIFRFSAVVIFALSFVMVFHPDVRSSLRSIFKPEQRSVLSTAKAIFSTSEGEFNFVKIRTLDGIYVEVYKKGSHSESVLVDRIELPKHKDAFFTFNGQATNLAIDDIDSDTQLELLVPSFDSQLIAHLNVFKFNPESHRFEAQNPSSF